MTNKENRPLYFLLADDHSLIRQGMTFLLDDIGINNKVFHASNFQQLMECINLHPIDIAVVDAYFPEGSSLELIAKMKEYRPEMKILIFSGIDEVLNAIKFINEGANGFLSKLNDEEEIRKALTSIIQEGEYISPVTKGLLMNSLRKRKLVNPLLSLTKRELQIARMYAAGRGNLEIANVLNVRQNTISTIKKRIFKKLGINNILELVEILKSNF